MENAIPVSCGSRYGWAWMHRRTWKALDAINADDMSHQELYSKVKALLIVDPIFLRWRARATK